MNAEELQEQLQDADMERIGKYMEMFDRILLYTVAVNTMPKEAIQGTVNVWEKVIKRGIDGEATKRTDFLQGTRDGRRARYEKQPDGETLRLNFLKQCGIAKNIILSNLSQNRDESEEN